MTTYKDSGVDVHAGYEAVRLMKKHVKKTMRPEVLNMIQSVLIVLLCVLMTLYAVERSHCFSLIILQHVRLSLKK